MRYSTVNKRIARLLMAFYLFLSFLVAISLAMAISDAMAETNSKVSIAVMDFSRGGSTILTPDGIIEIETRELTDMFTKSLFNTHKFHIPERNRLDRIMKELDLSETGKVKEHIQRAQLMGIDYLVMGTLYPADCKVTYKLMPYVDGKYTQIISGTLTADMRIVETDTSRIIQAETGRVSHQIKTTTNSANDENVPEVFSDDLRRRLVDQLVQYVLNACYPIKVIRYTQEVVYLNRGKESNLSPGYLLDAYKQGEPLVDPDTGAVLGNDEVKIAVIEITEVLEKFTKARIFSWEGHSRELKEGTICRPSTSRSDKTSTNDHQEDSSPKRARLPE